MSSKRRQAKKKSSARPYLIAAGCLSLLALAGGIFFWGHRSAPQSLDVYPQTLSPSSWRLTKVANNHQIEGYASSDSVAPGGSINFQVSCVSGTFTADIYRMGWYDGAGATQVAGLGARQCHKEIIPSPNPATGLVSANWPTTFRLHIPLSWQPGIYLAKLNAGDSYQNYVPFTIRSPKPQSPYLFVHSINTDNAYNQWGGNSLYTGLTPALKLTRAVEASLNRPFSMPGGNNDGSGDFLLWEYPMILFLEKNGYRVDYATDLNIHEHPGLLLKYKSIIITGHNEYWSRRMRQGYDTAVAKGVNLAVFAANTAYRPVRFEGDPHTKEPDRIMINYKSSALDPYTKTNPKYSTPSSWKVPPLSEPESELLGIAYANETRNEGKSSADLVVSDDTSWIFNGTNLKNGDAIPGLVGYEYDQYKDSLSHPANVDIVFHSPLVNADGKSDFADAGYYQSPGGGQVFDAGTMQWSWGLDPDKPTYSPQLVKVTENILNRFGGNPEKNRP